LILDKLEVPSTLPQEIQDEVKGLADKIVSGEIKVTDYLQAEATPEATTEATAEATPAS